MKIFESIKVKFADWLEPVLVPIIKEIAKEAIKKAFEAFFEKQPEHAKVALISLYPIIDVEIENLVKDTETKYDDAVVEGIMDGMEAIAKEQNLELSNLDDD